MQTRRSDLTNELIRQVIQVCSRCRQGRATLVCRRNLGQCHNKQVRQWRKKIDQIQKNKEATLCQKNGNLEQDTNRSRA